MTRSSSIGILLAAGYGSRYAGLAAGANKLMARMPGGMLVAEASAQALRQGVAAVLAVIRPDCPELADLLRAQGCHVFETLRAQEGMGASLAAAACHLQAQPDLGLEDTPVSLVVALADMPWIQTSTYVQVREALRHGSVAVPMFEGKRGHPVGFQASLLPALAQLGGDTGARSLLTRFDVQWLDCNDAGVLRDVDTPSDLTTSL